MKRQLSVAAILSTSTMPVAVCVATIVSGILLSSVNKAEACSHSKFKDEQRVEQVTWLSTPLAALVTIPGVAIATALSVGYRRYNRSN